MFGHQISGSNRISKSSSRLELSGLPARRERALQGLNLLRLFCVVTQGAGVGDTKIADCETART